MQSPMLARLKQFKRRISTAHGADISTPAARRKARLHYYLGDVGFLRVIWTNLFQIAPGVWRSNQPSPARLKKAKAMGIRTVLNLRGADVFSFYLFEKEACETLGLTLIDHKLQPRALVPRAQLLGLLEVFDRVERPVLMHCKSGADRAGLASALWLLHREGAEIDAARAMMSFRFLHRRGTSTGILDHMLDAYAADCETDPMPIRRWIAERYDPEALTASFRTARAARGRPAAKDGR